MIDDIRTLREFYPDDELRRQVHYHFAHRFLPQQVHRNPEAFFLCLFDAEAEGDRDVGTDPTRFIQSRWCKMEWECGLQPLPPLEEPPDALNRRVADLEARLEVFAKHRGLFIQMPEPEHSGNAHFIAVARLAGKEARYITLERSFPGLTNDPGILCSRSPRGGHENYCQWIEPTVDCFAEVVERSRSRTTVDH